MNQDIVVSIICNTYNHEKYIKKTLDSFLMQQTEYTYEILIHDDASTDNTANIIREYEKKFPMIIKPIFQIENKYSQGLSVTKINRARAKGKYYAICEGDDFWVDKNKIQTQIDFLEKNHEFSACVHASLMVEGISEAVLSEIRGSNSDREFSTDEIILGGGGLFSTNSIIYRSKPYEFKPDFFYNNKYSFGDYQLIIYLSLVGKIFYFNRIMSAYRYQVPGSWSESNWRSEEKRVKSLLDVNAVLNDINLETNFKHNIAIQKTKINNVIYISQLQKKCNLVKSLIDTKYYKSLSLKEKITIQLKCRFPNIVERIGLAKEKMFSERR